MKRSLSILAMCAVLLSPVVALADTGILTWLANPEPDLTGYKLYCGKTSGASDLASMPVVLGKVTTYTVTLPQLRVDQNYFCRLTATGSGGESTPSNEVTKKIAGVLAPPTNFKAVISGTSTILSWSPVTGAPGYLLRVHKIGTPYDPCSSIAYCGPLETATSKTLTLAAGDYDAWVSAADSLTVFGSAQGLTFTVPVVAVPPSAPTGLKVQ